MVGAPSLGNLRQETAWPDGKDLGAGSHTVLGSDRSRKAMNPRLSLHSPMGSEDLWGAEKGWGRMGRCEPSSFRKPVWVRHRIPRSFPRPSNAGCSFFPSCVSASNRHQTSSSMSWKMGVFNLGLIGVQTELAHGQRADAKWLSILGTRTWAEVSGRGEPHKS